MASLTGSSVASSYTSLLKLNGNTDSLVAGNGSNAIQVVDGDGTASPLYLNTDRLGIGGQPSNQLTVVGDSAIKNINIYTNSDAAVTSDTGARIFTTGDGGSGIYAENGHLVIQGRPAGRDIIFLTNSDASEKVRITSGGNVGIGTATPKHYSGTSGTVLSIHDSSYRGILELSGASNSDGGVIGVLTFANTENTAANGALAQLYTEVETSDSNAGDDSGGHLLFFTKPEAGSLTEGMRIDSSGKTGIGTQNPLAKLVVSDGGNAGIEFQPEIATDTNRITNFDRTASAYMNFRLDALTQQFLISGSEVMRLDSTGLGIGVAPSSNLHISNSSGAGHLIVETTSASHGVLLDLKASADRDAEIIFREGASAKAIIFNDASNNSLSLSDGSGGLSPVLNIKSGSVGIGTASPSDYDAGADNLVVYDSSIAGITIVGGTTGQSNIHFGDGTGASSYRGVIQYRHGSNDDMRFYTAGSHRLTFNSSGDVLPAADDAQDIGSSSLRFDDIHATNGAIQTSDERLKDNIADSSLGLDFVNALRPVKYQWKDYSYDVEKEKAVEAKEAEYETVVVQEAVEAKEAVMGTRQKTVSKEVEKTKTEIVEEDGKYVQKEVSYTETVEEPQYEEVNLYDEDGEVIGSHKIPVMEEYEVEPAVEAVEEVTEQRLVSEAIEAKDAVMETKEKTFARTHFGLIAQEVEQVLKDSSLTNNDFAGLIYDEDSDRYGMRYHELIAPLIKAVQELSKKVTDLENK